MTGFTIHTLLSWLCGMKHCPAGEKTILRVREHCQSRRKLVLFQDNAVLGLILAPFTKNVPLIPALAEAPPDHHISSIHFQLCARHYGL